jgi:hypothetical protein
MQFQGPINEQLFNELVRAAAAGKSREAVITNLRHRGIPSRTAESAADEAFRLKKKVFRQQGMRLLLGGVLVLAAGLAISGLPQLLTSSIFHGDGNVLTSSFVIGGLFFILKGLLRMMTNR